MDPSTKSWIIPLTFLFNRSNGKTKSKKMKPSNILINEDVTMIAWLSGIKECKWSINLVQLKTKVIKLTQTKLITFQKYQIIASGIGCRENIHKLAFDEQKDWTLTKHKVELLIHILLSTMICKHCTKNKITQHHMEFKQSIRKI